MATNYNTLITSEKNLKKMIVEFLEYSFSTHEKLWNNIYDYETKEQYKILDSIERRTKEAEQMERDLVDECIWTISKDDPRANHLRFIISVIYSSKDIAKSANYSLSIARIFVRKKINSENILMLKDLVEEYLMLFRNYINLYKEKKNKTNDIFEVTETLFTNFIESVHEKSKKIRKELTKEDHELDYFPISQITKLIESTIERVKSIFANIVTKEIK